MRILGKLAMAGFIDTKARVSLVVLLQLFQEHKLNYLISNKTIVSPFTHSKVIML